MRTNPREIVALLQAGLTAKEVPNGSALDLNRLAMEKAFGQTAHLEAIPCLREAPQHETEKRPRQEVLSRSQKE